MISTLNDETTFYQNFLKDLIKAKKEVIIESPFITTERMKIFRPIFKELVEKGVKIFVVTRDPREHEGDYKWQAEEEISYFEKTGIQALLCKGNHHRKLAMIDRKIIWEGSLNILSQSKSREIMRRIEEKKLAVEMFEFLKYNKVI